MESSSGLYSLEMKFWAERGPHLRAISHFHAYSPASKDQSRQGRTAGIYSLVVAASPVLITREDLILHHCSGPVLY